MTLHKVAITAGLIMVCALSPVFAYSQETSASGIRKLKDVVLYRDAQFHCAFPSVVALPGGELLCGFRRAPSRSTLWGVGDRHVDANSYLVGTRSTDGGATWTSTPELLYAHPFGGSQDPCLLGLQDGSLLCASYGWAPVPAGKAESMKARVFFAHEFGFLGGYLLRSQDRGRTWAGPIYPPPVPGNVSESTLGGELPAYNRGAMVQGKDGALLWAVARHETINPLRTSVQLMRSKDRGSSWMHQGEVATDPQHSLNETSLLIAENGDLLAFLRVEIEDGRAAIARSRDGGETFEPWQNLGFHGIPLQAISLPGNRLLVVYGYRRKPFGVRARIIKDDLSDAATAEELVLRDDGAGADLGYPWAVSLGGNRVLVVYYINKGGAPPHIAGTLLEIK